MRPTRVQESLLNKVGFQTRPSANELGQSPRRDINLFRISTASGGERGFINDRLDSATLTTARGTDPRKGESTMNRLLQIAIALGVVSGFALCAQSVISAGVGYMTQAKGMSEYKGVKLGLKRDAGKTATGKPARLPQPSRDFNLAGDDKMTVHYENGEVKAIQLAFSDPKNAPPWKEVVGDAEVSETSTGAKTARKIMEAEKFWVSIYQTKDGATTRITISR